MTKRMIDGKIRHSQTFQKFTYRQRDLWHGLIEVADDQGRLPGNLPNVRSLVWPADDISLEDVDKDLSVLKRAGNIIRYDIEGCKYIQITNWQKYQAEAEWLGLSEYPHPTGWHDRARFHGKNRAIITLNWGEQIDDVIYATTFDKDTGKKVSVPYTLPLSLPYIELFNDGEGDVNGEGISAETAHPDPSYEDCTPDGEPIQEKKKKKPKDERSVSPAIISFRRLTGLYPPKVNYEQVISVLGDQPDEAKMKRCYQDWCARGFKPTNINWLLDWYVNGVPIRGKPSGTLIGADAVKAELQRLEQEANNGG